MGVALGCVLAAMLAGERHTAARLDEVFARWAEAEKGCKSLVVEFTLTQSEPRTDDMVSAGTLRLARTDGGGVVAGCELTLTTKDRPARLHTLVSEGRVYLLDPERKAATRWENAEGGAAGFVERNFLPFVLLLDQERAERKCRVAVAGEDRDYTYLAVSAAASRGVISPGVIRVVMPDSLPAGRNGGMVNGAGAGWPNSASTSSGRAAFIV
jgi:hypothetical protein